MEWKTSDLQNHIQCTSVLLFRVKVILVLVNISEPIETITRYTHIGF